MSVANRWQHGAWISGSDVAATRLSVSK